MGFRFRLLENSDYLTFSCYTPKVSVFSNMTTVYGCIFNLPAVSIQTCYHQNHTAHWRIASHYRDRIGRFCPAGEEPPPDTGAGTRQVVSGPGHPRLHHVLGGGPERPPSEEDMWLINQQIENKTFHLGGKPFVKTQSCLTYVYI